MSPVGPVPVIERHHGEITGDSQARLVRDCVSFCSPCHYDQNARESKFKEGMVCSGSWFQIHHDVKGMVELVRQEKELVTRRGGVRARCILPAVPV